MISQQIKDMGNLVKSNEGRVMTSRKGNLVISTHIGMKVKKTHKRAIENNLCEPCGGVFDKTLKEEGSFKILTTIKEVGSSEFLSINLLNNNTDYSQLPDCSGKGYNLLGLNGYYTNPKFRNKGLGGMINGYHSYRISKLLKEQEKNPEEYCLSVQDHVYQYMKKTSKGGIQIVDFDFYDIIGSC